MRQLARDILIEVMEDVIEDLHGHVHRVSDLSVALGTGLFADIPDSACKVCHNLGLHQTGTVRLEDADVAGTFYDFQLWTDLGGDPDVSTFCMSCHDANGAARLGRASDSSRASPGVTLHRE